MGIAQGRAILWCVFTAPADYRVCRLRLNATGEFVCRYI
jgi:hypothetical protein